MTADTCFTCRVATGAATTPGGLVVDTGDVVVNHRATDLDEFGQPRPWPGWFIVSPRRHVARMHELSAAGRARLFDTAADLDRALTELFGARRCMVASLGWLVSDHVHAHVVPTFTDPTRGWENFARPGPDLGIPVVQVTRRVSERLAGR